MKKYKGAVFFDFDGTLADENLQIYKPLPKTIEGIQKLKENGYMVGIATGRAKCYVPDVDIDFDCYVTTNGAYAEVDNEEIFNSCMSTEELRILLDFFHENGIGYVLESQDKCYWSDTGREDFIRMVNTFHIDLSCFAPIVDLSAIKTNKLMVEFQREEQFDRFKEAFDDRYVITRHRTHPSGDVGKTGIDKSVGIHAVMEHFGLALQDTYAFGDGENDLQMLSVVGCGIAMKNHAAILDTVAKRIAGGVDEDGIYYELKDLGLI